MKDKYAAQQVKEFDGKIFKPMTDSTKDVMDSMNAVEERVDYQPHQGGDNHPEARPKADATTLAGRRYLRARRRTPADDAVEETYIEYEVKKKKKKRKKKKKSLEEPEA
eukprot:16444538-Heterocapsa_arctica.AAC.1